MALPIEKLGTTYAERTATIDQERAKQYAVAGVHQSAGEDQPRHALAEPPEQRQTNTVDHPRPQPFQVVDQERERKGSDRALVDPILGEARR